MSETAQEFPPQPKDAALALQVWMVTHGVSGKELASRLGCSKSQLSKWRSRREKPRRALAVKLEQVTGGAVAVKSWDLTGNEAEGDV